ncbi:MULTISPECIES: hypothetical protein [unclassified Frankia]|uniref:hypothetical protein n=1 Tax=unclassified Frankia TaxID=2632575 RepID=UPI001EF45F33|nr:MULTISPECIES: hypothetical protein [unclassified Frankia]
MIEPRRRCAVDCALLALAALTLLMALSGTHSPVRAVLAVLAAALLPGAAALTTLRLDDALTWLAVTVSVSLAMLTLLAVVTVEVGWWNPTALLLCLGLASGGVLAWDLRRALGELSATAPDRRRDHERHHEHGQRREHEQRHEHERRQG